MSADPSEAYARLARTVNIAPDLGAPLERGWTASIERSHLEACAEHGFTAIRLLITFAAHRTPTGLDPATLRRVEEIARHAAELGLAVVISNNPDPGLIAGPESHLAATRATAGQLAAVFAGRGAGLILEPLTEPREALDAMWNKVAAELIGAIRENAPDTTVLIGPRTMNNQRFLAELSLPEDERNVIVGIHHYWPVTFTMQGEMFLGGNHPFGNPRDWLGTTWDQTPAQEAELRAGFGQIAGWSARTGRPLFLAEFGTTSNAGLASRVRWTRFNRRLAEEHGIPWGIWSLGPTFAICDLATRTFNPDLLAALTD
jgi:endoglucanase